MDPGSKRRLNDLKASLSAAVGGASDHLLLVRVYNDWALMHPGQQRTFASQNFLSNGTLLMIHGMRHQMLTELQHCGLVPSLQAASLNASNPAIVRCVLVRTHPSCRCLCPLVSLCFVNA